MVATVDYHSSGGGYENLRGANPVGGVETMAMPQRDDTIEAIKRLDACGRLRALRVRRWRISSPKRSFCGASLEYAVMHDDEEEAERLREELRKLTESV